MAIKAVIFDLDGTITQPHLDFDAIREEMEGQLTSSVQWTASVNRMVSQGVSAFVEIGPKNVLAGLIRRINKEVNTYNVGTPAEIQKFLEA